MAIIARSTASIVIDNIATVLESFATSQAAEDSAADFAVHKRKAFVIPRITTPRAAVNVWLSRINPGAAVTPQYMQEEAVVYVDCFARGTSTAGGEGADEDAMDRLEYLAQQTKYALFSLVRYEYGLSVGEIAKKEWPAFDMLQPNEEVNEQSIVAGRWTLRFQYAWAPEDVTTVSLDEIFVQDADPTNRWSALHEYGG